MSRETSTWLNTMTLIGFTEKRGHAWHYREDKQGDVPNHYPLAIPVEDVRSRLFDWRPIEGTIESRATIISEDGVEDVVLRDDDRKSIIRPPRTFGPDDKGAILGVFKEGYQIHLYEVWLLDTIANLLDDDLRIGSAGLLSGGAKAWVSVEVPENITTPEGVEFRPNLMGGTSLDGSLATTFARVVTNVVCDNTMSAALREKGEKLKVKHSRYSEIKLQDARQALSLIHTLADEFMAQVADLCAVKVSEADWHRFLEAAAPTKEKNGEVKTGRGLTMATNKQDTLKKLWSNDLRVAPWRNTAFGVVQAMNTATHHEFTVRGTNRVERNAERAVTGRVDRLDLDTLEMLQAVMA